MDFIILPNKTYPPSNVRSKAYLLEDNWDDGFKYSTQYYLIVFDGKGEKKEIGAVKIGQFNMRDDQRRPDLPNSFVKLDSNFFSVGQDDDYYDELNKLGETERDNILDSLNDFARDLDLFKRASEENVTSVSLLRSITFSTVQGQFHRLTQGGLRLTPYKFKYKGASQVDKTAPPIELDFTVEPESTPPTNIHVIVGKNGVGKTFLLNNMMQAFVYRNLDEAKNGSFISYDDDLNKELFANLVSVSFSAFDSFEPFTNVQDFSKTRYSYIGLKRNDTNDEIGSTKSHKELTNDFVQSLKNNVGPKRERWESALKTLETDPIFSAAEISGLVKESSGTSLEKNASELFSKLSSGHKIVLLSITRLVEAVEEKTLVLMDEPESHLHPPLLSAFVRALSDLLIDRNGIAIIATHSPVVVQEVPKRCVWKIRRNGGIVSAERSEIETFGENVGVLTRDIFGLEVTNAGFHKMLIDSVQVRDRYEDVVNSFKGELGDEAKAIIRALITRKIQRDST